MYMYMCSNYLLQLTEGTYGAAVAMLSEVIRPTENDRVEQNEAVLNSVANYFEELAFFVNDSNVTVNATVSHHQCPLCINAHFVPEKKKY